VLLGCYRTPTIFLSAVVRRESDDAMRENDWEGDSEAATEANAPMLKVGQVNVRTGDGFC
jgi:hypothetical protein